MPKMSQAARRAPAMPELRMPMSIIAPVLPRRKSKTSWIPASAMTDRFRLRGNDGNEG